MMKTVLTTAMLATLALTSATAIHPTTTADSQEVAYKLAAKISQLNTTSNPVDEIIQYLEDEFGDPGSIVCVRGTMRTFSQDPTTFVIQLYYEATDPSRASAPVAPATTSQNGTNTMKMITVGLGAKNECETPSRPSIDPKQLSRGGAEPYVQVSALGGITTSSLEAWAKWMGA